jgi:hypothetical protein
LWCLVELKIESAHRAASGVEAVLVINSFNESLMGSALRKEADSYLKVPYKGSLFTRLADAGQNTHTPKAAHRKIKSTPDIY